MLLLKIIIASDNSSHLHSIHTWGHFLSVEKFASPRCAPLEGTHNIVSRRFCTINNLKHVRTVFLVVLQYTTVHYSAVQYLNILHTLGSLCCGGGCIPLPASRDRARLGDDHGVPVLKHFARFSERSCPSQQVLTSLPQKPCKFQWRREKSLRSEQQTSVAR